MKYMYSWRFTQDKHSCVYKVVPVLHDRPIKEALDEF